MDFDHKVAGIIYVLAASHTDDAPDLIAVGGDHSVEILLVVLLNSCFVFVFLLISTLGTYFLPFNRFVSYRDPHNCDSLVSSLRLAFQH